MAYFAWPCVIITYERLACTTAHLCEVKITGHHSHTLFLDILYFRAYFLGNNTKYFLKCGWMRKKPQHMKFDGRHFYFFLEKYMVGKSVIQQKKSRGLITELCCCIDRPFLFRSMNLS